MENKKKSALIVILSFDGDVKLIYSEKATKFCETSIVDLSYVVPIKSTLEISQNYVAFSEYMSFIVCNTINKNPFS